MKAATKLCKWDNSDSATRSIAITTIVNFSKRGNDLPIIQAAKANATI
jgi:hypothetical protein